MQPASPRLSDLQPVGVVGGEYHGGRRSRRVLVSIPPRLRLRRPASCRLWGLPEGWTTCGESWMLLMARTPLPSARLELQGSCTMGKTCGAGVLSGCAAVRSMHRFDPS